MNITQRIKYLFGNLCLLVAFCMPTSLLAVETITMDPECVSMESSTGETGSASFKEKTNTVTFTIENAQEGVEYRLLDDGSQSKYNSFRTTYGSYGHIVTLEATTDNPNIYTGTTTIKYYNSNFSDNGGQKNADHVVRFFQLQKKVNGVWTNVDGVTYTVKNCWVECGSRTSVSSITTVVDNCHITNDEFEEQMREVNALPIAHNTTGYYCFAYSVGNNNICRDLSTYLKIGDNYLPRVWVLSPKGDKLDVCTLQNTSGSSLTVIVRSCPEFQTPTFTVDPSTCKVGYNEIYTELRAEANNNGTFDGCNGSTLNASSSTPTLQNGETDYEPDTYTATWQFSGYQCKQTFKVVSPTLTCIPPVSKIETGITDGCTKAVQLTAPSTGGMCGDISVSWSRNGTTFTDVAAGLTFTEDFYANSNPYTITWKVSDGASVATCSTEVKVNYMDCSDYTFVSNSKHVEFALPTIGGCGDTGGTLSASLNSQTLDTSNNKVSVDLPNYGAYDVVIKATQNNSSSILKTCTSHILLVEPTDVCK